MRDINITPIHQTRPLFPYGFALLMALLLGTLVKFEVYGERPIKVYHLTCEYAVDPIGIDKSKARLSWLIKGHERGIVQSAFQILVASSEELLNKKEVDIWDSGKRLSAQSVHFSPEFKLASRNRYHWQVRVWDQNGDVSDYSLPAFWETGLDEEDWSATWITSPPVEDPNSFFPQRKREFEDDRYQKREASPLFRKEIQLSKPVHKGILYISGLGYYELFINGKALNERSLDPAFSNYSKSVYYTTYDLTKTIQVGTNAIGVMLGNGFYNPETMDDWGFDLAPWRDRPTLRLQLEIEYQDGTTLTINSDESWKVKNGPIVSNSIRAGITYDARREINNWNLPEFDDDDWVQAIAARPPLGQLRASQAPPVKAVATFKPKSVERLPSGQWMVDLGVNIAGWAAISMKGKREDTIVIKYGERLMEDGSLDNEHISIKSRGEVQVDTYIMNGVEVEKYEPHFVYHGFQYVEVNGYEGSLTLDDIEIYFVRTAFEKTGAFSSSDETLNWIQSANQRSYESNFHSIPTDCPHREKNGWTGDAHLAAETGFYNYNIASALSKWMIDVRDAQKPDGRIPGIIPTPGWGYQIYHDILDPMGPGWDGALVLIPWYQYLYRGDVQILRDNYQSMKNYLLLTEQLSDGYISSFGIGDWAAPKSETHWSVTSTGYYYAMAKIMSDIASILKIPDDKQYFQKVSRNIRKAFNEEFMGDSLPIYSTGTQTAQSVALYHGLVDSASQEGALQHLITNIEKEDYHIDCGILGTKPLYRVLGEYGKVDVAYKMLTATTYPSYGYWMSNGATTLCESWACHDSRNHVMFGDISAWMFTYLAGISPTSDQPGYKRVKIAPQLPLGLSWVNASIDTNYGQVKSAWNVSQDGTHYTISICPNTTASITLTRTANQELLENDKPISEANDILSYRNTESTFELELGSGEYYFTVR